MKDGSFSSNIMEDVVTHVSSLSSLGFVPLR